MPLIAVKKRTCSKIPDRNQRNNSFQEVFVLFSQLCKNPAKIDRMNKFQISSSYEDVHFGICESLNYHFFTITLM